MKELSADKFKEIFNSCAEDVGNSETVEDVLVVNTQEHQIVSFTINANRWGYRKPNTITLNDYGVTKIDIWEALEGGDVEFELKKRLHEFLTT